MRIFIEVEPEVIYVRSVDTATVFCIALDREQSEVNSCMECMDIMPQSTRALLIAFGSLSRYADEGYSLPCGEVERYPIVSWSREEGDGRPV